MNNQDRLRLMRLQQIISAVPFSASGTATSTGMGAVSFEQDMRAIRPYIAKVLEGMVLEGREELEEGVDYENPDVLMDQLEEWLSVRGSNGWAYADAHSFAELRKGWV